MFFRDLLENLLYFLWGKTKLFGIMISKPYHLFQVSYIIDTLFYSIENYSTLDFVYKD